MPDPIFEIRKAIEDAKASLAKAHLLLNSLSEAEQVSHVVEKRLEDCGDGDAKEIIEGVFDGAQMVGPDGKVYAVPANYASKSKLVEGDILKLRVARNGAFIFKQIGPVDRRRVKGLLLHGEVEGDYRVLANGRSFRVLTASVTYYKGQEGDETTILVPQAADSRWAAVDNILKEEDATPEVPDLSNVSGPSEIPGLPVQPIQPGSDTGSETSSPHIA